VVSVRVVGVVSRVVVFRFDLICSLGGCWLRDLLEIDRLIRVRELERSIMCVWLCCGMVMGCRESSRE
jgi:hypothetical protein